MGLLYEELTGQIIKCCMDVSTDLGVGFLESVYKNALAIALAGAGLNAVVEAPMEVFFGGHGVGQFRADIVVNDCVIVELKACEGLIGAHSAQLINYLKASGLDVGLLVNFGAYPVTVKRCTKPISLTFRKPPRRGDSQVG